MKRSINTNKIFFWRVLWARLPNILILPSRICRDLWGCCHAHSNWRAACNSREIVNIILIMFLIEWSSWPVLTGIRELSFALPMAVLVAFFWHLALVLRYAASKNGLIRFVAISKRSLRYRILRGGDGVLPIYILGTSRTKKPLCFMQLRTLTTLHKECGLTLGGSTHRKKETNAKIMKI